MMTFTERFEKFLKFMFLTTLGVKLMFPFNFVFLTNE